MSKMIKMKEPSVVRTYDKDGFRQRAACLCVNDDETKVLLVTSRKDDSLWIVPGGGVEPDETSAIAAVREVHEEAGVQGTLGRCLGVFENAERGHRTSVYVLEVTEELEDWDESRTYGRHRQWFTVEAAVSALHKPLQSNYVKLLLPPEHHYHRQPLHPHVLPMHLQPSASSTHTLLTTSLLTDTCDGRDDPGSALKDDHTLYQLATGTSLITSSSAESCSHHHSHYKNSSSVDNHQSDGERLPCAGVCHFASADVDTECMQAYSDSSLSTTITTSNSIINSCSNNTNVTYNESLPFAARPSVLQRDCCSCSASCSRSAQGAVVVGSSGVVREVTQDWQDQHKRILTGAPSLAASASISTG